MPAVEFDRFAADGGDLEPDQERRLAEKGTVFKRVPNEHATVERFKADIIAEFDELFERQVTE